MIRIERSWVILLVIAFALQGVVVVNAQEKEKLNPVLEKAIGQYKHENYEEALGLLKQVRQEEPQSTIAAYYLGLTYKKMQDYKAAIPPLRDAVTYVPKIKGALVELIDCLGQTGDLEEARKWIGEAEREDIRPAQVAFLTGLINMKDNKPAEAIEAFGKAKRIDPAMGQACDYQIGLADVKMKKFGEARTYFKQVIITDPNSTMANYANEYMDAVAKTEEATKAFNVQAGIAWEYDDNVVLSPGSTTTAVGISDKADSREVTTAQADYTWHKGEPFSIRGQYNFYWAKQNNLGFYDTVANSFILQPTFTRESHMLSFPVSYNHYLVNDKAYLSMPTAGAVYNYMMNDWNMGQVTANYMYKDYLWGPPIPQEDRTSNYLGGSLAWYVFFDKNRGFFNARYGLNREWTMGSNWNYIGNRLTAVLLLPSSLILPKFDRANLTISGDTNFQNYTRSNSVFGVYRKDQIYTLSALATYKFYKDSEIRLQYTYVKDDSNVSVYTYTRNIYSAGVNFKF